MALQRVIFPLAATRHCKLAHRLLYITPSPRDPIRATCHPPQDRSKPTRRHRTQSRNVPTATLPHLVHVRRPRFLSNQTSTSRDRASPMFRLRLPRSHLAIIIPDAAHTFLLTCPCHLIRLAGPCFLNRRPLMRRSRLLRSCRRFHPSKPRRRHLLAYHISLLVESASTTSSFTRRRTPCTTASAKSICITGATRHASIPSLINACIRELTATLATSVSILANRREPCLGCQHIPGLYNLPFTSIPPAHVSNRSPVFDYVPLFVEHPFSHFSFASYNSEHGYRTGTPTLFLLYCFEAFWYFFFKRTDETIFFRIHGSIRSRSHSLPANMSSLLLLGYGVYSAVVTLFN